MVRYELIKQQKDFTSLVASGVIPLTISTWIKVYETFIGELKENPKPIAIQFTADYFNLTTKTVYKVVSFMET